MGMLIALVTALYMIGYTVFGVLLLICGVQVYVQGGPQLQFVLCGTIYELEAITAIGIGALLVLIVLFHVLCLVKNKTPKPSFSYENDNGKVEISYTAIEDFVIKIGSEFEEIRNIRPSIVATSGHDMLISITVDLVGGCIIQKTTEALQKAVKDRIQNVLGIENIVSIEVKVAKIADGCKVSSGNIGGSEYE